MTLKSPLFEENNTYSATQLRAMFDLLFTAGVLLPGDLVVTQHAGSVNRSVDVAAGSCVVTGTDVTEQGKYLCESDAIFNVPLAAAPSSGNSRIDLIVGTVRDADADGGANNDWVIQAVTGTAAATGSQVAPSAPASSLILAQVLVGPTVTTIVNANITDERPSAVRKQNKRVVVVAQSATPTINTDLTDIAVITGLAQAITGITFTGTPSDGDGLRLRITDNGTAHSLTPGSSVANTSVLFPATTPGSSGTVRAGLEWNAATSKWEVIGTA